MSRGDSLAIAAILSYKISIAIGRLETVQRLFHVADIRGETLATPLRAPRSNGPLACASSSSPFGWHEPERAATRNAVAGVIPTETGG